MLCFDGFAFGSSCHGNDSAPKIKDPDNLNRKEAIIHVEQHHTQLDCGVHEPGPYNVRQVHRNENGNLTRRGSRGCSSLLNSVCFTVRLYSWRRSIVVHQERRGSLRKGIEEDIWSPL